jgi:hypothetical protein
MKKYVVTSTHDVAAHLATRQSSASKKPQIVESLNPTKFLVPLGISAGTNIPEVAHDATMWNSVGMH